MILHINIYIYIYMLIYHQIISFSQEDWLWFEQRLEYPFFSSRFSEPSGCFLFSMSCKDVNGPPNAKSRRGGNSVLRLFPLFFVEKFGVIFQLHRWWVHPSPPPQLKSRKQSAKKSSLSIHFLQQEIHNSELCIIHYVIYISYTCLKIRDP